uniref:Phosphatidic acid phosphatase type 2/haloperoxidase domain-containing protein n=1 Tax=Meloidogyne incognita TaxID=6306 RepID=A0A914KLR4_MELIC
MPNNGITIFQFIIGEYWRLVDHRTASEHLVIYEHGESFRVRLLIRLIFFQGFFCIAILATLIFTSLTKFSVGRLRPNFLAICDPLINGKEKEAHFCSLPENQHFYVENYTCGNASNPSLIFEGRLSFFSGHSSLSMCAAVFTALYLHCRLKPLFNYVVVIPLLQICVLSTAMFIAYTRIRDNLHHWSDIFVGMATGSSVASFVGLTIVGFKLNTHTFEESISLKEGRRNVPSG